jgi:hypothetical protein
MIPFDKRDRDVLEVYRQRLHDYWLNAGGTSADSDSCDLQRLADWHLAHDLAIEHPVTNGLREYWRERHGQA